MVDAGEKKTCIQGEGRLRILSIVMTTRIKQQLTRPMSISQSSSWKAFMRKALAYVRKATHMYVRARNTIAVTTSLWLLFSERSTSPEEDMLTQVLPSRKEGACSELEGKGDKISGKKEARGAV